MRTVEQQQTLLGFGLLRCKERVTAEISKCGASRSDKEEMMLIMNAPSGYDSWTAYCQANTAVRNRLMNIIEGRTEKQRTMTMEEIISKVEHEIKFQRMQAGEYESGVHADEVTFARYDQAAKILEWVLGLLKGQEEHA